MLLAIGPALADEPPVMVLEGDVSALYANGDFVVWNPKQGSRGTMMTAATAVAKPGDKPPSIESTLDVVAKAPIGPDGKFRLEAVADSPRRVYFYVLNAVSPEGHRMAPVKGNDFILEPGELELTMSRRGRFVIEGGYYNDEVYNSWRLSDEYEAAQADQARLYTPVDGEAEEDKRRRLDLAAEAQNKVLSLESEGRAHAATTHPDPMVRRLTIETTWLSGPWMLDALRGLAELTPEDPWVTERLARAEEGAAKRAEERKRFAIGADIRDFTADTLEGEAVSLADVRANSSLVLLEFWASWCGPCRVEIPHMKEAYGRFRAKGFEIVSFTIDDDREAWEEASDEEDLPWINLGMGPEAEAPTVYNVTGVPKNYLVDSGTGDIVAKDLRGHKLDEKLEELLN
ncbi:MAG: TlpA disulfide reductase family protein [Gammaproteobacteria bacterium]|nr:TlpA disulfide reductase family protein [Gammaproteobacteria bacterium]